MEVVTLLSWRFFLKSWLPQVLGFLCQEINTKFLEFVHFVQNIERSIWWGAFQSSGACSISSPCHALIWLYPRLGWSRAGASNSYHLKGLRLKEKGPSGPQFIEEWSQSKIYCQKWYYLSILNSFRKQFLVKKASKSQFSIIILILFDFKSNAGRIDTLGGPHAAPCLRPLM